MPHPRECLPPSPPPFAPPLSPFFERFSNGARGVGRASQGCEQQREGELHLTPLGQTLLVWRADAVLLNPADSTARVGQTRLPTSTASPDHGDPVPRISGTRRSPSRGIHSCFLY